MFDTRHPYETQAWPNSGWSFWHIPQQGWICPRCGTVWSPSMIMCTCKPAQVINSSTSDYAVDDQLLEQMANDPAIQAEMKAIHDEETGQA